MTDAVLQMVDRMRMANRPELLMLLAAVINEMTISVAHIMVKRTLSISFVERTRLCIA